MPDGFSLSLIDYTPPTLLGLAVVLIFFGLLVPRWVYQEKVKEVEYLKKALELRAEAQERSTAQTAELLEATKTNAKFLQALVGAKEGGESE